MKGHPFSALTGARDMLERIFGKDIPDEIADSKSPVAKGRAVWWHENYKMAMDSLGLCFEWIPRTFLNRPRGPTRLRRAIMPYWGLPGKMT